MNGIIILAILIIILTIAIIIAAIMDSRKKKPTQSDITQFCIEHHLVLCSKEWVEEAQKALEDRKTYSEMTKTDNIWGSSIRTLKR